MSGSRDPDQIFRESVHAHFGQLRTLLNSVAEHEAAAVQRARLITDILGGAAEAQGFEAVERGAELVGRAPPETFHPRLVGFVDLLQDVTEGGTGAGSASNGWMVHAAGPFPPDVGRGALMRVRDQMSVPGAWSSAAELLGIDPDALADRIAERLQVARADLSGPTSYAARLVPVSLIEAGPLLPLREDGVRFVAASANPTALGLIGALERITGRIVEFEVAPPGALDEAVRRLLGSGGSERPLVVPTLDSGPVVPPPVTGTSVLVVDDDESVRHMVKWILDVENFEVHEAEDGPEALEWLEAQTPSLVILDLNMPRMDGREVLRRLREAENFVPVLVLTGASDTEVEAELIEAGADDYLRKPFDPRILVARIGAIRRRSGTR